MGSVGPPAGDPGSSAAAATGFSVVSGMAPAASGGFGSVVMLTPTDGEIARPPAGRSFMTQFGYAFAPAVVAVRPGDEVEFSNDEDVIHNVHVVERATGETVFNVTTLQGIPFHHTFERPGVYDVACHVHPQMLAFIVVDAAPFLAVAAAGGRFEIGEVPAGTYAARVWSADPDRQVERSVEIGGAVTTLDLTR